jgi:SRSO17 transposase
LSGAASPGTSLPGIGILSETARTNGWQLAEHAGEARPDGMQRFLSRAVWDTDGVRDDLRSSVLEQLGQESALLVIAETSFPKRGEHSAGVGLQYCGTTGRVEHCQVGVFLSSVTAKGHSLIDRELYLPFDWCEDRNRSLAGGIPDRVRFQTKPELAVQMIERIRLAPIPIAWIGADPVYGGNLDRRTWMEAHQYPSVLAGACNEPVGFQTPDGRRREEAALVEAFLLADHDWQRLAMGEGTKGPRLFDWAIVPLLHRWQEDGRHWLLLRRRIADPQEKQDYFVFAPPETPFCEMVKALGARWHIEVDCENAKDLGLDHYAVRSLIGWYRHITLVMLAHAFLAGICAHAQNSTSTPLSQAFPDATPPLKTSLPLTIPEVRHLLGLLIWPPPRNMKQALAWSWWRRCHRSVARYSHTKRRLKASSSWPALPPSVLVWFPPCSFPRPPRNFLEGAEVWEYS